MNQYQKLYNQFIERKDSTKVMSVGYIMQNVEN